MTMPSPKPLTDVRWWGDEREPGSRHEIVIAHARYLETEQARIHERFLQNAWLYHQTPLMGRDGEWEQVGLGLGGESTTNLCESRVDAVIALVAKNHPKIVILTENATWSTKQKAKNLERYIDGEFDRLGVYEIVTDMFRDACVFGTGVLKIGHEDGKVCVERVLIDDMILDERECRSAPPRTIYQLYLMDIDVLCAMDFMDEEKRAAVIRASSMDGVRHWTANRRAALSQIPVVEAWHLPSGPGKKDGRYVMACEGCDLQDQEGIEDHPFLFYRWSKRLTGFYGRGLIDQLAPKQMRVNKLNWVWAKAQDFVGRVRGFVSPADQDLVNAVDNSVGAIYVSKGGGITWDAPRTVSPDFMQHLEILKVEADDEAGVSHAVQTGQKPNGVESAIAIRAVAEREMGRFAIQAQRLEDTYKALAVKFVTTQKSIAKGNPDAATTWRSRDLVKRIAWRDVDMEEDRYVLDVEAASLLSDSPAGRAQEVIELGQAGMLKRDQAVELLPYPDLQRAYSLATASRHLIESAIEKLEDEREPIPVPNEFYDLTLGMSMVGAAMAQAELDGAPDETLERFRKWIAKAQALLGIAEEGERMANAATAPMPMPGMPPGAGGPMDPAAMMAAESAGADPDAIGSAALTGMDEPMALSAQAMGLPPQ